VAAQPVWFGPADRPLFGWLHAPPDAAARAGAVICPPVGREYTQSHYALRVIADELSGRGVLALRFDYDGTGDSAGGPDDPGRVAAWARSVAEAIALVRRTGTSRIALIGLRLGTLLAVRAAAEDADVDQLVLWDPVLSGASFVREQKGLASLTLGISTALPDGSVDLPGITLRPGTVAELRALRADHLAAPPARRVLALMRPGHAGDRPALAALGREPVDVVEVAGQETLLEVGPPFQTLPDDTLSRVVDWVADGASAPAAALRLPSAAGPSVIGTVDGGHPLVERPCRIAPAGLFAILTETPGAPDGPVAVFLTVANEPHTGPSRLWVDLARRWGGLGIRSLRVDLSGIGDSPVRCEEQEPFVARAPEAFSDVEDIVRDARGLGSGEVVLVGVCSAAYQAIDSALRLHPAGIVAINPVISFIPAEYRRGRPLDPRRTVAIPRRLATTALRDTAPVARLRSRHPGLRRRVRALAQPGRPLAGPAAVSMALGWRARFLRRPRSRPSAWLPSLVREGTDVLLVANERDARPVRFGVSTRLLSQLERSGRFRFEYLPALEHSLLAGPDRRTVADLLTDHMVEKFVPATGITPPLEAAAEV
jgi:dienelactone hydrolase